MRHSLLLFTIAGSTLSLRTPIRQYSKSILFAMGLTTQVATAGSSNTIDHTASIMFLGSCFSTSMAQRLRERKLNVVSNPQGILFNPKSISSCIDRLVQSDFLFQEPDLFLDLTDQDIYYSWHHGREYSSVSPAEALQKMNDEIRTGHKHLKKASTLFLTLGTSFAYELIQTGEIVSNCHKQPGKLFEKIELSVEDIVSR